MKHKDVRPAGAGSSWLGDEQFRALIESVPIGIAIVDQVGNLLACNDVMLTYGGHDREDVQKIGNISRLFSDPTQHEEIFARLSLEGVLKKSPVRIKRKGGSDYAALLSLTPMSFRGQAAVIVVVEDLTEHKRAEPALESESEQRFRAYVEQAPDGVFVIDGAGCYQDVNVAACRLLGYSTDELLHMHATQVVPEGTVAEVGRGMALLRRDGLYSSELPFLRKDGSQFIGLLSATRINDDRYLGIVKDITERRRAEVALRESAELMRYIVRHDPSAIAVYDRTLHYLAVSDRYLKDYNVEEQDIIGKQHYDVFPEMPQRWKDVHQRCLAGAVERNDDDQFERPDGSITYNRWECRPWHEANGNIGGIITYTEVTTERRRTEAEKAKLEAQLQQAQKMESVGRLAGGVAHDFNNMLGVILGHAELALAQVSPAQPLRDDLLAIRAAAKRSADLTRQLLAFARKQTVAPKLLDLSEEVEAMLGMLRRLIGEDIDLVWRPGPTPCRVKVDPSQIDQILANLCANARDAIEGVGKVTIETATITIDDTYCALHPGAVPGDYVRLSVSDDGSGMDADAQAHLFEPFFTTKAVGKGTGLGLATVYGSVKQNDGFISLYSEPGIGTTFTIYLPRQMGEGWPTRAEGAAALTSRGHETILLVEDEPSILSMTKRLLERQGYTVVPAGTPGEALRLAKEYTGEIDLLMTDVVMPGMNGRDLAEKLRSVYPHVKRLFTSGYTADVIGHHGVLDEGVQFLQKPFSADDLAAKVRETIDARG
jgi:PAS domain S-box-containing protein